MWSGSGLLFYSACAAETRTARDPPPARYNQGDRYMGLRERTAAVLQLKKDFQSPESAGSAGTSPLAQSSPTHASWLRQPDAGFIGNEQTHQWLLPWVFGALFIIGVVTAVRGWQQV